AFPSDTRMLVSPAVVKFEFAEGPRGEDRKVRRVSLLVPPGPFFSPMWGGPPRRPPAHPPGDQPRADPAKAPPAGERPKAPAAPRTALFIQCAYDANILKARVKEFQGQRDEELGRLEVEQAASLQALPNRLILL